MESCQYEPVISIGDKSSDKKWIPFLRQLMVCSSIWISLFSLGLCNGAPTVMIPQLRRAANSSETVSDEMASWLSSIQSYAAIPWVIILPRFMERYGRKLPFLFISCCTFCSFLIYYFSSSVTHILLGEVIQGTISGAGITIYYIIISEYSSPRYRGVFLALNFTSQVWGMWCSNALGTFFDWKTIAVLGMFCSAYCIVNSCFWIESSIWLASKGYFIKSAASHRWLKGTDKDSEKELEILITETQRKIQSNFENESIGRPAENLIFFVDICKPISLCLALMSLFIFSGKLVCNVYAIDIIKKITLNESAAYTGMLILDGVSVLGMYVGCVLSKFVNRRTLLLSGSFIGILFLYLMSLYLYLIQLSVIIENNYVSIVLLSIFSLTISMGPMLMCSIISGEIIPLKFRSLFVFVIGVYSSILIGTIIKIAPYLFKTFQSHGTFLFFGVTSTIFAMILYKYLPETKDMTLLQIEKCLKTSSKEEKEQCRT